jgi:hypothetical protein
MGGCCRASKVVISGDGLRGRTRAELTSLATTGRFSRIEPSTQECRSLGHDAHALPKYRVWLRFSDGVRGRSARRDGPLRPPADRRRAARTAAIAALRVERMIRSCGRTASTLHRSTCGRICSTGRVCSVRAMMLIETSANRERELAPTGPRFDRNTRPVATRRSLPHLESSATRQARDEVALGLELDTQFSEASVRGIRILPATICRTSSSSSR